MKNVLLTLVSVSVIAAHAVAFELVTTSSDGVVASGYPFEPAPECMIEMVYRGNSTIPLTVTLSDGTTVTRGPEFIWGAKLVGVTRIVPSEAGRHGYIWKVSKREEFARTGASYLLIPPDLDEFVTVPAGSIATLISPTSAAQTELRFTDPNFDGTVGHVWLLNRPISGLRRIRSGISFQLWEFLPDPPPSSRTVTIQRTIDLVFWEPVVSFQVPADGEREFFRMVVQ